MAVCPGKRMNGTRCTFPLHRCKKCGHVGCSSGNPIVCSNQAFKNGVCIKCGAVNQKELF
jgi:ribosomal protein L40E